MINGLISFSQEEYTCSCMNVIRAKLNQATNSTTKTFEEAVWSMYNTSLVRNRFHATLAEKYHFHLNSAIMHVFRRKDADSYHHIYGSNMADTIYIKIQFADMKIIPARSRQNPRVIGVLAVM